MTFVESKQPTTPGVDHVHGVRTAPIPENTTGERKVERDIRAMQTVYTIMIVLGVRSLAESLFVAVQHDLLTFRFFAASIVGIGLSLVGVRFFWATGNIARYLDRQGVMALEDTPSDVRTHRMTVTVLFPMLMGHALLYYVACKAHMGLYLDGAAITSTRQVWTMSSAITLMLVLNCVWLVMLYGPGVWRRCAPRGQDPQLVAVRSARLWWRSNLVTALVSGALMIACAAGWCDFESDLLGLVICLGILLIGNSVCDLIQTSRIYLQSAER